MSRRLRHRIVIPLVVLGAIGVGGSALAASSSGGNSFLDDVARRLGIAPAKLQSAINQALADRLNQLVKQGKLTRAQADAIEKAARAHGGVPFAGPFGAFPHFGFRGGPPPFSMGGPFGSLRAAAKYLGVSLQTLASDLRTDGTLAAVAKAKGKSVTGLEQAMLAARKAQIENAVKAGKLTRSQADDFESALARRIDTLVNSRLALGFGGPALAAPAAQQL